MGIGGSILQGLILLAFGYLKFYFFNENPYGWDIVHEEFIFIRFKFFLNLIYVLFNRLNVRKKRGIIGTRIKETSD